MKLRDLKKGWALMPMPAKPPYAAETSSAGSEGRQTHLTHATLQATELGEGR